MPHTQFSQDPIEPQMTLEATEHAQNQVFVDLPLKSFILSVSLYKLK